MSQLINVRWKTSMMIMFTVMAAAFCGSCSSDTTVTVPTPTHSNAVTVFEESHDGGLTWDPLDTMGIDMKKLFSGALVDQEEVFLLAGTDTTGKGAIWRSTDYGDTFVKIFQDPNVSDISFLIGPRDAGTDVAAVSSVGRFYVSNDRGLSWNEIADENRAIYGIDFFDNGVIGIAVGKDGGIFRTQNGGFGWALVASGETADFNDVHCLGIGSPNDTAIIVGNQGKVLKSVDAGITWTTLTPYTTNDLNTVSFSENLSGRYGLIAAFYGGPPGVHKSTDGGTTWSSVAPGVSIGQNDLTVFSSGVCISAGSGGIFYSNNSGLTWSHPIQSVNLYGINARNGDYIFCVGQY